MKGKIILSTVLLFTTLVSAGFCEIPPVLEGEKCARIINKNSHYEVILDYQKLPSHRKMGEAYASQILRMVPNYEFLMDSYLKEWFDAFQSQKNIGTAELLQRVDDIKPQLKPEYRDEIEGIASRFSGPNQTIPGDGKLSVDEVYMFNLISDVCRASQCSAFGVYGERSPTGRTIAARILDWYEGAQNQWGQIQAVTTFQNGPKSICTVGYLGYVGVITGLNDNNVFAGILDAATGQSYSSQGKRSYVFDLRDALEQYTTLDAVGNFLKAPDRSYAFSHLIFLSDATTCKVLENNIYTGENCLRALRTEESVLNDGIEWGITNAVGCVNSFILKGNLDTHSPYLSNTARWESMKRELVGQGTKINAEQAKTVASYHQPNTLTPGREVDENLYNSGTQQIVIFEPNKDLQVFFRPRSGILPETPCFEKVPLNF